MDGFVINKTFYCKELGALKAGKDEGDSYLFDIGTRWHDLTRKQQKHCMFLTRNMHKLPFRVSRGTNPIPLSNLNTIVKCFYDSVKLNNLSNIAYKGVQHLQIPSVNLEDFGCPKADFLFHALVWLETCGHHLGTHAYQHCPKVEVEALEKWLREQQRNLLSR